MTIQEFTKIVEAIRNSPDAAEKLDKLLDLVTEAIDWLLEANMLVADLSAWMVDVYDPGVSHEDIAQSGDKLARRVKHYIEERGLAPDEPRILS